jgi:hypothetical protein
MSEDEQFRFDQQEHIVRVLKSLALQSPLLNPPKDSNDD